MPTATAEVETTPKPLAPSGARQRLQEVAGAMDEFFQSDDWKTADSTARQQHLDRITGVFDEEYSRAAPDLNPDEADQLFNSGVSFLKGRLAESGDAPPLDAFPSEGAMKAADALRQTRNDANAPEPNAEDYGKYGLEAIQLKRSSAQERYPKERLDFIKKTGLRPEHVDRLMDDREALERLKDNAVVMKTTGEVAVPPQKAMDEAEWNSAVDATNATPEKKAKAKAHRLKVRDQLAGKIEFSLAAVDPEWEKWSAGMAGEMKDASIGEKVERFIKWRKASGAKMSAIDRAVDQNAASFVKQFFGLIGGITNIGMMKEAAATAGEIEQANATVRAAIGGAGATGFAVDLFGGLAPTIAFSPLARLATTNLGAMRLMAGIGAAQGYGGKYADASAAYSEQGLSDQEAHMKAQLPALVSALTTYALARMMPRGVESIGQINSAKAAAKTAYRKWAGELLADVGDEALEEAFQAVSDEITAKFTYDPKKDMRTALENIFMSGLMGGIGGGVVGAVSRYANKVKPILETAEQMRKDGYPLAAAETEKTAEIEATKQYWADVAKAQKRAVEHTQANEGPQTERAAYGRTGDVYDAFGNVQRKSGSFLGLPDAGNPEGAPKAVGDANYKPEPAKESEPKNEKAQSVPSVQKADEPVRLPQKEVAPAAPSPEPVTPVAAKPVEQPTPAPKDTTERIQEAAYRDASGKIYKTGAFHDSSKLPKKFQADNENARGVEPGWLTSSGRFVGREEGFAIAAASKQVKDSYKAEWPNVLGHFNVKPETLGKQPTTAQIEQAIADANWLGTVREVPAPRSMGGEGVKLYIPVDASGKDVSVGGQTILGKTPAEAIELAQKNTKPAPAPPAAAPSPATPQSEGGIFGYSWADIRSKQQGGTLAALIRGNAPKATESDFAVLEKHGMDWLYDNKKVGIIDRLGLPVERPSKKAVEAKATEGQFSIYQMERKDGMKWMVQSGEKRGFGDGIFDTKAEAEKYAATEKTRQQERAAAVEREAQKNRDEEAAKELRERDVNDFTAAIGATPLAAGKLKKTLMEQVAKRTAGKVYEGTRAQVAKQLLAAGFKPTSEQVDAVKDLTGAQMNRMDNKEQAAHEKRKREAGKKTEYRLENSEGNLFEVTKAEHDYAKWLEAAQVNAAPAPVTEAAALRAKIVKGATVEVSLVRGSKLTHRAKVQDVDTQNGVVTVTFKKGKKFNGGETQTVRLDQVAPLASVQTRMLNEVQFEGMTEDQKRQTKADAKEFDNLVADHPEMGWYNWRVDDLAGTKSGDMDIAAERKRASMEAMEALGGDPTWIHKDNSVMKAELLPKLKAAIEEKAHELAREAPDSALSDDTDLLPQGEAPATPKLRPSDGKGTGELLQGDAAPFNLVAETAADIAKREAREAAEQIAKDAKDAAEAKAKQDKEQGNLFDDDPFTIADTAPATSLPVESVQRAVRVVAGRLAGAMPHEVIADGSQYPQRVKDAMHELMAFQKWKDSSFPERAALLKAAGQKDFHKGKSSRKLSGNKRSKLISEWKKGTQSEKAVIQRELGLSYNQSRLGFYDLPDHAQRALIRKHPRPAVSDLNRIRGVVVSGEIYINAASIEHARQAIETFMHEAAGHGGVDALLKAFGEKATTQLDAMLKRLFPDDYAAVQRSYEPSKQVSETLARIMQRVGPEMSAQARTRWQRVMDWLRNALNNLGVKRWSANDVMALLRRGVDAVRKSAVAKKSTDVSALVGNELTYAAREAGVMLTPEQTMRVINRDPAVTADVQARVSDARGEGAKMSVVERDSENMEELPLSNFDRSSENDGYLYHVTTKDRVDAVVYEGEGLKAGADGQFQGAAARNNSKGRIFLTERSGVATWAHEIEQQLFHSRDYSEEQDPRDDLTVVRVPRNLVDGLRDDFAEKPAVKGRDYYTEKPIPASPVEPKFSLKDSRITPDQDREYLAAVKRGDMETAQRMLKDAAVKKFGAPFVESESVQTQRIYVTKNANKQIAYSRERIANLPTDEQVKEQYLADRKAWELAVSDPDNATVDETIEAIHRGIKPVNYTVEDALRSRDMEREGAEKEIRIAQAWKDRTPEGPEQTHFQTGKPFVTKAYHATPFGRLETFDDGMLGAFTGAPSAKLAHFFAGSQKVAESYFVDSSWLLQQKGFLKLSGEQKTELVSAVREELGSNPSADEVANIAEEITGETYDPSPIENELHEVFVHLKNPLVHDFQGDGYRDTSYRELLEKAEKEGHDGVVLANTYDAGPAALMDDHGPSTNVIAVLRGHSSQIKSAESSSVPLSERFNPDSSDIRFSLKDENPEATSTTKKAVMDKEREVAMLQGSADKLLQDIRKSGRPPTVEEMQQIAAIDSLIAKRQAEIQAEASNVAQGATPPEINIADLNAEPPDREETGESGPRTYGGKFDSMDAQRAERGLPPLARRFRKANRVLWDAAVKRFETEPKWADRLVDEISSGEKTVLTDEEFAGVFAQQIDLHNKRQEAADRARDPNLSEEEQRDALDQFQYYEKKLQASEILKGMAGSEAGAALQSLKLMANEDFSLAAMEARERKAKQSGLTPEEVDRIRDEATRIAKAQADLDARKAATEAAERIANAEAKIAEWSKIPSRVLEYAKQKVNEWVSAGNAASERLRARAGQVNVGVDPMILGDIFLFARGKIAQGMESFGNFAASTASEFGEWVRPYLKPAWDKAMKYLNTNQPGRKVSDKQKARQQAATEDAASIEDGIRAMAEEGLPDDMGRYVKRLANAYVKSGATTVKGVMARLHAFLDPVMGNPTDDVLLDLWTDYGGGKAATEDALKRLQSQIRQEALIVRQIIDAEAALVRSQAGEDVGDYLKLTGQQRVPVRDQARALAQQLNELKKKIPPPQSTAESRRQSALDALEKRTRNRIKDLRFEIAKGERTIKNRGVTPTSPNLEALRAELATVEAEHLAVFGRREATPEQKLKSAIKSAERAEQKALAELEAAKRGVFTRPVQKGAETRNEVLVIRARADAARAETQALKELANPPLSDAQKRLDAALVARERWEQMLAGEQQPTSRQPQESLTQLEEDARMEIAAMRELAAQIRRDAKPATDPDDAKVRALEAAAAEYERRVNESDFTAKSKTTTADSARVAQARALRDAALAAYNAAKNVAGVTEQTKLANRKAAMLRQIADLTDRLAKSDFEKRPPRPPVDLSKDPEAVRIASDLQEIKSNYAKRLLHYIKERRGGYEKFTDAMWTAFTAERSLMGSGDLSAPRQAVRMVKAHPIMAAKAMWRSIQTIFSQKQAVSYEAERKLRPNYALYKPMKIQMPSVEAEAHDRMAEEGVRSNIEDWADIKLSGNPLLVLPKLVPKLLGHYVRASSRTFTTFLNELAADVADYRINELRDKPMSKIEKEALGDMINSGRGRGLKAGAGKLAQFVFYSANFLAARAKNLSGYHIWRRNSSMRIRKIALKEQFRAIAGWMVVSAISRYFYGDTGDDEDMFDKAKRLFKMKVTDSDARMEYDYTGGEVKLARIGAALIEGISTTIHAMRSGQEEADKQRAFKSYAAIGHTLRDISAPWVGVVSDLFTGSNYDGKVPTVPSIARDLTVPLAWRSADEFFERAGFAKTVGAKLQEAIGVGVSVTRDKTAPKERRYSR